VEVSEACLQANPDPEARFKANSDREELFKANPDREELFKDYFLSHLLDLEVPFFVTRGEMFRKIAIPPSSTNMHVGSTPLASSPVLSPAPRLHLPG
jgi:hypothetical protein